jgi:hypothetical protein
MSTLAEFVAKYTDQVATSPHGLGGECVDLVVLYVAEVIGDKEDRPFTGNAVDIFGQRSAPGGYKWVRNDLGNLTQVPPRGAIMVWGGPSTVGTGPLGHVDIVLDATGTYFNGFDQNWPLHARCRVVRHSYVDVIGWGYPQNWDAQPIPIEPQTPLANVPPAEPVKHEPPAAPDYHIFSFEVKPPDASEFVPQTAPMQFADAIANARLYLADHTGATVTVSTEVKTT